MFFPDKMKSIRATDRVLEVGPGAAPCARADVLLELRFESEEDAFNQRGRVDLKEADPRTVYYGGSAFPFQDGEFDYVICSHVVEHVPDVGLFVSELTRVARAGYLEFPLINYEYLFNIPEHQNFVYFNGSKLLWMSKSESGLAQFAEVQDVLSTTLALGYSMLIDQLTLAFIQGFEWSGRLETQRVTEVSKLSPPRKSLGLVPIGESKWMKDHTLIRLDELARLQAVEARVYQLAELEERVFALENAKEIKLGRWIRKLLGRRQL